MEQSATVKWVAKFSGLIVLPLLAACAGPVQLADDGPKATYLTVLVHRGDTVSEIAQRYSIPTATLIRMNGLDDGNAIYAGEALRIPAVSHATREAVLHESSAQHYAEWNTPGAATKPVAIHKLRPVETNLHSPRPVPRAAEIATNEPVLSGTGEFEWPVEGRIILPFGGNDGGVKNDGINIAAHMGEPIRAAADGTVIYAGNELKGYGNLVLIKHDNGYTTAYAHAQSISVARGDSVRKGQTIGYAGATGDVTTPQVHFEIRQGVRPIDPRPLLLASRES